jgi:rare lipoprotein A
MRISALSFAVLVIILSSSVYSVPTIQLAATSIPTSSCVKATFKGIASTYNPNKPGWKTGGQSLATGGTYNPNEYEAALQLDLAKQYRCGYGAGAVCQAIVQTPSGKSLLLRINDNGPLVPGRIIDLNEKSMRYLSGGSLGDNSGLLKDVTVTLLCDSSNTQLGPLNDQERAEWASKTFGAPYANTGNGSFAQTLNNATGGALGNSPLGQFLGLQPTQQQYAQQQPINGVTGSSGGSGSTSAGSTSATGSSSTIPRSTPAVIGTTTNGTNTSNPSLPLTDAVLAQAQAQQSAVNTTNPNAPVQSIKDAPPTLLCVPGVVEPNEQALVFWSCNDASTTARMSANTNEQCETGDKTSGVMCAHPATTTTYTLNCNKGTTAQCLIEVINPTLALITTPRSIVHGGTVDISWQSNDTQDCVLKSDTQPTFSRRGVSGDVVSHTLSQDTTFTLLCETRTGAIREKEITVDVI